MDEQAKLRELTTCYQQPLSSLGLLRAVDLQGAEFLGAFPALDVTDDPVRPVRRLTVLTHVVDFIQRLFRVLRLLG